MVINKMDVVPICVQGKVPCQVYVRANIGDLYEHLQKQGAISYTALLTGAIENPGGINEIKNTRMNTTNCWSELTLHFIEAVGYESIRLDGKPLACDVKNPVVKFQY